MIAHQTTDRQKAHGHLRSEQHLEHAKASCFKSLITMIPPTPHHGISALCFSIEPPRPSSRPAKSHAFFSSMLYHYPPKGHHTVFTLIRVVQARRSGKLESLDARQRERKRRSVRCLGEDRYTHIRYGDGILHFYVLFTCLHKINCSP